MAKFKLLLEKIKIKRIPGDEPTFRMNFDGKGTSVHHHIYEAIHGKLINGFIVRHTCDNPL